MLDFKAFCKTKGVSPVIAGKDIALNAIVQELSDIHGKTVEYKQVSGQIYDGQINFNGYFFYGLGLTSKLNEEQKTRFFHIDIGASELAEAQATAAQGLEAAIGHVADEANGADEADEADGSNEADEADGSNEADEAESSDE
jgi:hypothetical protein